jgi:hypothetical protein
VEAVPVSPVVRVPHRLDAKTALASAERGLRVPAALALSLLKTETMHSHTYPSLAALESNDDDQLAVELQLARLRAQVAVVRTVVDEIDRLARPSDVDGLGEQFVAEVARLGRQLFNAIQGGPHAHSKP